MKKLLILLLLPVGSCGAIRVKPPDLVEVAWEACQDWLDFEPDPIVDDRRGFFDRMFNTKRSIIITTGRTQLEQEERDREVCNSACPADLGSIPCFRPCIACDSAINDAIFAGF